MRRRGLQAEKSTCKGPEVGPFLVCLRNGGEDSGLEQSGTGERRSQTTGTWLGHGRGLGLHRE